MIQSKDFAEKLAKKIPNGKQACKSKSGVPLFFETSTMSRMFTNLFGIKDITTFDNAFQIATGGQGDELRKINSVASSALLPLLVFHPLFKKGNQSIKIDGIEYNRAFFEVRNNVIRRPSCVDVVLLSSVTKTLLFLESKMTEYMDDLAKEKEYGKGYMKAYSHPKISNALKEGGIKCTENLDGVALSTEDESRAYIEGIKQSFSHIIGIVRGPQNFHNEDTYPKTYYDEYVKAYTDAKKCIYATIIFNPSDVVEFELEQFHAYHDLYKKIFSKGVEIVDAVKDLWPKGEGISKEISIIDHPITYQEIFKDKCTYLDLLPKIKEFYRL